MASAFFFLSDGVGEGRNLKGPMGRTIWPFGAISPSTGPLGRGGCRLEDELVSSVSLVDRFSLFDEGTRRELPETRDRNERAAKDLDPRRTCSEGERGGVSEAVKSC